MKNHFEQQIIESLLTKKHHCQACSNKKHGVKTRKQIPHTCQLQELYKEANNHHH